METKTNWAGIVGSLVVGVLLGAGGTHMHMSKMMDEKMMASDMMMQDSKMASDKMMSEKKMDSTSDGVTVGGAKMVASKDIVDNALNASNVTTVVAAVKAADLVATLKSEGPFTVFAPTNAAFDKLPAGTVETLLKAENKKTLAGILTYHVVAGTYTTADLKEGTVLTTVNGQKLTVKRNGTKVMLVGAKSTATIETANVISSNGVTHVIDTVLLPADK